MTLIPATAEHAFALLHQVGASPRLVRHAELVLEAATALIAGLRALGVPAQAEFIAVGAVLHDAGKAVHVRELDNPGTLHEPDGEALLLRHGASPDVARVCRSHAQWRDLDASFEELIVALADKLWKGVRVPELEELVIAQATRASSQEPWTLFTALDELFEQIASGADDRLARSRRP